MLDNFVVEKEGKSYSLYMGFNEDGTMNDPSKEIMRKLTKGTIDKLSIKVNFHREHVGIFIGKENIKEHKEIKDGDLVEITFSNLKMYETEKDGFHIKIEEIEEIEIRKC